jgi:hypothetical protein
MDVASGGQEGGVRVVVCATHGVANAGKLTHGCDVSVGEVESCVRAAGGVRGCEEGVQSLAGQARGYGSSRDVVAVDMEPKSRWFGWYCSVSATYISDDTE